MQSKQLLHLKQSGSSKKKTPQSNPIAPSPHPHQENKTISSKPLFGNDFQNTKLCLNLTLSQFTNNVFIKFDAVHCILCTVAFV